MSLIVICYIQQMLPGQPVTRREPEKLIPELEALLKLWRRRYGAWPLPERSLLTAGDLQRWSRNLTQIEHGAGGRFHVRTFGFDLIRRFGRESTGQCIDDLARDIRESLHDPLSHCLSIGGPVTARPSIAFGHHVAVFCELVLPLDHASLLLASYE